MKKEKILTVEDVKEAIKKTWPAEVPTNTKVYGVPRGGTYIASLLNEMGLAEMVTFPEDAEWIVDDLVDSGRTMNHWVAKYPDKSFWYLFTSSDEWIVFPWEVSQRGEAENLIVRTFQHIGENPNRTGLIDTPRRVVKMWDEIFRGYDEDQKPEVTVFPNGEDGVVYDQMICDTGDFYSMCEHHMMPFIGKYWFAYIPSAEGQVLGLSKVARVVDYFSAKLQIQERLGKEIIEYLYQSLVEGIPAEGGPLGIALCLEAEHLCKTMRGVKKKGKMRTLIVEGLFKDNPSAKEEFLAYVNGRGQQ